jgi:hypothetical protein
MDKSEIIYQPGRILKKGSKKHLLARQGKYVPGYIPTGIYQGGRFTRPTRVPCREGG